MSSSDSSSPNQSADRQASIPSEISKGNTSFLTGDTGVTNKARQPDPYAETLNLPPEASQEASAVAVPPMNDYEILSELGRGGMGVVYKVRQKSLDRVVALKMVLAGKLASESVIQRFLIEAKSAAALDHPGIVPIFETGRLSGQPYFTMAFIEGTSLSHILRTQQKLSAYDACMIMADVADAVAYAHEKNIIHRDLKPDNILIDRQGRPRVTDFGLAKRVDEEQNLTLDGTVMGTPHYMSPEQARGDNRLIGKSSDVYALGAILFHLLTGRTPFQGDTTMDLLLNVMTAPVPSARSVNPDVPQELERLCTRSLEKDQERRSITAAQFADELRTWLQTMMSQLKQSDIKLRRLSNILPGTDSVPKPTTPQGNVNKSNTVRVIIAIISLGMIGIGLAFFLNGNKNPIEKKEDEVAKKTTSPSTEIKQTYQVVEDVQFPSATLREFSVKVEMEGGEKGADGIRRYKVGTPLILKVQSEKDAYLGVWTTDAKGTIVQLFPNQNEPDNFLKANLQRTIPGNDTYEIISEVSKGGNEELRIVVTTEKWSGIQGNKIGPFQEYKSDTQKQSIVRLVRGFVLRPKDAPAKQNVRQVSETSQLYRIEP